MSPNCSKNSLRLWSVVWYGNPPTNIFVKVVSFCVTTVAAMVSVSNLILLAALANKGCSARRNSRNDKTIFLLYFLFTGPVENLLNRFSQTQYQELPERFKCYKKLINIYTSTFLAVSNSESIYTY